MLKLIGILALVSVAFAAVARFPHEEKPEKYADQEGCYLSKLDKVLPYDVPYNSGEAPCGQYICQKSSNETLFETCGAIEDGEGCHKSKEDLTKNYPACCGIKVCDGTTTPAPTTQSPTSEAPNTQGPSVAYAHAESGGGKPPVTETYTSGPGAAASATAA